MAYTTIDDPTAYFQCKLFTGNASSNAITFDGNTNMQPDFVWVKSRSQAYGHMLYNSVSGVGKYLSAESNAAENANAPDTLTAFGSNGFTLDDQDNANYTNGGTGVAWSWKESATAGFDICSWTGNGSAQNISHNLSKVPTMIIVKNRTDAGADWYVYNVNNGNTHSMILNTNSAKVGAYSDNWNNTTPTSSVFTVGSSNSTGGSSGDNMIAYVFTDIQGYSKFGSYTGNGNADGTFVYTGFKPSWLMVKKSSGSGTWFMYDNKRDPDNQMAEYLYPNTSAAAGTSSSGFDFLSNGIKIRNTFGDANVNGNTFIYIAFAEAPLVGTNNVPCTAR